MNITSIIVEDIQIAADFLKKFCEKSGLVEVKGHFLNVTDALDYLDQDKVDLIFLDVEMPGATGFDLMDRLTYSPKIILTTTKTEYAFDAFQYNVSDYLKKPISYKRFLESMQKISKPEQAPPTTTTKPATAATPPSAEITAEQGALFSHYADWSSLRRRTADYVDKILKGAAPGDLPVEQPKSFDLVVNLKTAKALGLTIPRLILLRAERIIE